MIMGNRPMSLVRYGINHFLPSITYLLYSASFVSVDGRDTVKYGSSNGAHDQLGALNAPDIIWEGKRNNPVSYRYVSCRAFIRHHVKVSRTNVIATTFSFFSIAFSFRLLTTRHFTSRTRSASNAEAG